MTERREGEAAAAPKKEPWGHVPPGVRTSYPTAADDPRVLRARERDRERVAAFQARVDARHQRARDAAVELREIRESMGLTQAEVAGLLGVPHGHINSAENVGTLSAERVENLLARYRALRAGRSGSESLTPTSRG